MVMFMRTASIFRFRHIAYDFSTPPPQHTHTHTHKHTHNTEEMIDMADLEEGWWGLLKRRVVGSKRTPASTMCTVEDGGSKRTPVSAMCTIEEVREVQPNTCIVGSTRTPMTAMCTVGEVGGVQSNTCVGHVYNRGGS